MPRQWLLAGHVCLNISPWPVFWENSSGCSDTGSLAQCRRQGLLGGGRPSWAGHPGSLGLRSLVHQRGS